MARMRLNWNYDPITQTFTTPSGVVSLLELANCRYSMLTSSFDLGGPWKGWRMCGDKLKPPGGSRLPVLRPTMTALFLRWLRELEARENARVDPRRPIVHHLELVRQQKRVGREKVCPSVPIREDVRAG